MKTPALSHVDSKLLELLHTHRNLNLLPLLELLSEQTPDCLKAFCNQVIFTLSELLRDPQPGGVLPSHVMQIIQQLHTLREAFRQVRGAPCWP
jgi:chemotaxis methyl-accepting protein methylase